MKVFLNENNKKKKINADILYAQELSTVIQLNPGLWWYILVPSILCQCSALPEQ